MSRNNSSTSCLASHDAPVVVNDNVNDVNVVIDVEDLHRAACNMGSNSYKDPATGFTCFTELAHLKRGVCCGSQCRHCPYGWANVSSINSSNDAKTAKVKSGDRAAIRLLLEAMESNATGIGSNGHGDGVGRSANGLNGRAAVAPPASVPLPLQLPDNGNSTTGTTRKLKTGGRHGGRTTAKNVPYTRGGDQGTTALFTGERRSKADAAFDAMGTVDELCSVTGVCYAHIQQMIQQHEQQQAQFQQTNNDPNDKSLAANTTSDGSTTQRNVDGLLQLNEWLLDIMSRLFDVGSHVAKPPARRKVTSDDDDDSDSDADTDDVPALFTADGVGGGFHAAHITELEDWIDQMTEQLPELLSFVLPTGCLAAAQLHVARTVCRRAERSVVPLVVNDNVCDPNALRYLNRLSDFYFTAARFVNFQAGVDEILYRRPQRGATQRERQVAATTSVAAATTAAAPDTRPPA